MKRWMRILKSITCVLACMMLFGSIAFASELPAEGEELHYVDVSENVIKLGGLFKTAEAGYVSAPSPKLSKLPDPLDTTYGLRCNIRDAILNQEESIMIAAYAPNLAELRDIYAQVLNENPELVNATGGFSWGGPSSSLITTLYPEYSKVYTRENVDELKAKAQAIVEGMSSTFTDEQKILYLHDYLVTHCQYDTDTLALYNQYTPQEIVNLEKGKFNAYNALIEGTAVCQGYSEAMVLLGNYANLDIRLVTSDANNHAWNMINLDDVWYFFDCTWDDPTSDNGYLYPMYCCHINLLRSRDGLVGTGHVGTDWTNDKLGNVYGYATESEKYDSYYWMNTTSAIPILGDTCAYAKEGVFGKVYLRKTDNSEQEITASALKYWKVWNGGGDYYPTTNFACFAAYGDSFYFNTPTEIFRLGTDGTLEKVHELSASAVGYIYGIQAGVTGIDYWVGVEYKECEYVKGTKEIELTDPELKITNVSLVLQDNLAINFIADKTPFNKDGYGTPYAVFNVNGTEKTVMAREYDDDNYVFTCNNIAPKMIGDKIGITVYVMKGEQKVKGRSSSYAAKDYCDTALQRMTSNEKLMTLIVDLLNYGAAAQTYGSYRTDALVNRDLTPEQQGKATPSREYVSVMAADKTKENYTGVVFTSMALVLNETVAIRYYFTAASVSGLTLEITDDLGHSWTYGAESFVHESDDKYHVDFRKLQAKRMSDKVYATFHKGEGLQSLTAVYSIESYANVVLTNSAYEAYPLLRDLVSCMMKYGDAAKAYGSSQQ